MTVLTGVSVGLFLGVILLQMQYAVEETGLHSGGEKIKGTNANPYGKNGNYQDQSKAGKGDALTNEARTGNTD